MNSQKTEIEQIKANVLSEYEQLVQSHDVDESIVLLAEKYELPYSYVRTLVNMGTTRNNSIIDDYLKGLHVRVLAEKYELSEARIRQIVSPFMPRKDPSKDLAELEQLAQLVVVEFERKLPLAIQMGERIDSPYDALIKAVAERDGVAERAAKAQVDKYKSLGFNAYRVLTDKRNEIICSIAMGCAMSDSEICNAVAEKGLTATDIAKSLGMTRDRIYGILHENGVRKRHTLTKDERRERNESIRKARASQEMSVQTIADVYGLSRVTVSSILNKKKKKK